MNDLMSIYKEIVSFLKMYGVQGLIYLLIFSYFCGVAVRIIPEDYAINKENILILGVMVLSFFNTFGRKKKETMDMEKRMTANHNVHRALLKLKSDINADRVFVIEFHNGKHNSTKLDFIYSDMMYEEANSDMVYVHDEYKNLSTSIYTFPDYLAMNHGFFGTVDEISEIDKKLSLRIQADGITHCGAVLLKSGGNIIGALGASYASKPKLKNNEIVAKLSFYAQDVGDYLDSSKL